MVDSYLHQGRRKALVELLAEKKITDPQVLAAIGKVPRHLFMDKNFEHYAYDDIAFQIGAGQTISQPFTVAFQTSLLELKPKERVLEIGTGSGYQASILAACGAIVYSIERQKTLYDRTKPLLMKMGYHHIKCFYGDGYAGLPHLAPFNKAIITAAAPFIPEAIIEQLKIGGCLVMPLLDKDHQSEVMLRITKLSESKTHIEEFDRDHAPSEMEAREIDRKRHKLFKFVPMLGGKTQED